MFPRTATICVLICLLSLGAWAQSGSAEDGSREAQIIALEKAWNQAQLMHDSGALQRLVGPRFINTEYDGAVSTRDQFLADISDPKFSPTAMGIQDVKVELYGDTAVVAGIYHTKGSSSGKPYEHLGRFTDTWIFSDGKWQCIASHTSLIKK